MENHQNGVSSKHGLDESHNLLIDEGIKELDRFYKDYPDYNLVFIYDDFNRNFPRYTLTPPDALLPQDVNPYLQRANAAVELLKSKKD